MTCLQKIASFFTAIGLTAALTACYSNNRHYALIDLEPPREAIEAASDDAAMHRYTLNATVNLISSYPNWDASGVSIDGKVTEQYRRFSWLKKYATEEELIKLTDHQSGIVKAYAFQALCDRNSPSIKKIFESHVNDLTRFPKYAGCTSSSSSINIFYLDVISDKLTDKELADYKKAVHKHFAPDSYLLYF